MDNQGKWQILTKNGIEISKRTFDRHIEEIKSEISNLHDIDSKNKPFDKSELEKLFSQPDYINFLKKVIEGEPAGDKTPTFKDRLQAGKQIAEYFGWNAAKKIEVEGEFMQLFISGKFKTEPPPGNPNTSFKEL